MSIIEFLSVKEDKAHVKVGNLQNPDLVPLPPARRTWHWWGFTSYWLIYNVSSSGFTSANSLIGYGLSVPHTMAVILLGNFLVLTHTILNGQPGADHHISFTTYARVLFGSYGCYVGILIRSILACVWYASNAWQGGLMVNSTISCLSKNYLYLENTLPDSVPFSTKELIGFIIFQLLVLPLLVRQIHQIRGTMLGVAIMGYAAILGMCIFAVVDNGGSSGPLMATTSSSVHGAAFSWTFVRAISQWYGTSCVGTINKPDFCRFSKNRITWIYGSIFGKMVLATFVPFMGIVTASAIKGKWGELIWTPNALMDNWLEQYYTPGCRAAIFFCSVALWMVQIVFAAVANCWSFGMDFSGMAPRFINIRRGALIACVLCWLIQPWTMYNTSTNFGTVMSGFSVVLSPMIAIVICDYWVIRKCKLKLTDLYTNSPEGIYYGWKGFNIQAFAAWIIGLAPGLPGLIHASNPAIPLNNEGIIHYYYGNTLFGWTIGFTLYWVFCTIWKKPGLGEMDEADYYGTYRPQECEYWGVIPQDQVPKDILAKYVSVDELDASDESVSEEEDTDLKNPVKVAVEETSSAEKA